MKKALIIGACGFVGNYLIDHLKSLSDYKIYVTKMAHEKMSYNDIDIYDLNILNKSEVELLLKNIKPDYIFHLAAQSSVALSWKDPALTIDVNIKGSVNVLDAIRSLDYSPKVLMIGSGEEYGRVNADELPITEANSLRPGNVYAATKVCQNMISKIYSDAYNLDLVMVRAFNHIGPKQSDIFVVSDFCKQVAEIERGIKEPVLYVGNLEAKRDFTDVRDIVRAYEILIRKGEKGSTYNVGSGQAVSIKNILNVIISKSSCDIKITVDKNKLRPVDVPIIEADINKLVKVTNWKREIPLEMTIEETLNFWRANI